MSRNDDRTTSGPTDQKREETRDKRGRWVKGYCPNRKGRPKKKRTRDFDQTDLRWFANTLIPVRKEGKPVLMTRKEILYERIFESGIKDGKVSMLKFLYEELRENDRNLAELSVRFQHLVREWITDNPDWDTPGYDLPDKVADEIAELRDLLKHYYPGSFRGGETDEN